MKQMMLAGAAMLALAGCATTSLDDQAPVAAEAALDEAANANAAAATAPLPVPNNPLLADWAGPYGGVPAWDQYRPSQFGEAFTSRSTSNGGRSPRSSTMLRPPHSKM